jgi:MFS transporter, ACS family, tartrate transporter
MTEMPSDDHALAVPQPINDAMAVVPADSDARLIALWLHGRAARTQRSYRADASAFLRFVQKPLRQITLGDLQAYQDSLAPLAPAMLTGSAAAGGIALINSVGNLGGFLGPYVMRLVRDAAGSFSLGLLTIAMGSVVGGLIVLLLGHDRRLEQTASVAAQ